MVFDGQVPEPMSGSVMGDVGVRAYCWTVRQGAPAPALVRELAQSESDGREHAYEVCGIAGPARDFSSDSAEGARHAGAEFVLHAGDFRFLASTGGTPATSCRAPR